MKKTVSLILSLCMLVCFLPCVSAAEYDGKTVIVHTNDVHGAVGKYALIAGLKKDFEDKGAEVILADAGDFSQGSAAVSTEKGAFAVTMMNAVGYDIAVPGNHEFDYGTEALLENIGKAEFSVVCANISNGDYTMFPENCVIETKAGLKLGFFGLDTPEARTKANPALIRGVTFLADEDMFQTAKKQTEALSDADLVICLSHLGVDPASAPNTSYDLYKNVKDVDFIIDGHSHTVMTEGEKGEPIQSTGTELENAGVIVIDNETKKIEDHYLVELDDTVPADETVLAIADAKLEKLSKEYDAVFAKSAVELNGEKAPGNRTQETNLGDLIADAMLWAVKKEPESLEVPAENAVAVTNGGGIRAWIYKGDVTKNDLNAVLPFGNTLTVVYVTGAQLLEALEASTFCTPEAIGGFPQVAGMRYTVDTVKKYTPKPETYPESTYYGPASIGRVTITEIGGKEFDESALYAVVTNDFCAAGGDTYYAFANAEKQFDTGLPLDEVLMEYIGEELGGEIGEAYAQPQGRIKVKMSLGNIIKTFFLKLWTEIRNFFTGIFVKVKELFK